jgi:hypothetical protein
MSSVVVAAADRSSVLVVDPSIRILAQIVVTNLCSLQVSANTLATDANRSSSVFSPLVDAFSSDNFDSSSIVRLLKRK